MLTYHSGRFIPLAEQARELGITGSESGFFETFRTSGGRLHLWPQHRQRLVRACAGAEIMLPPDFLVHDQARLAAMVTRLLEANGCSDAVFRYTVSAGAGRPVESLVPRLLPEPAPADGVVLRVLRIPRDGSSRLPRAKSLDDTNVALGRGELQERAESASDEGLFLSQNGGWVSETTHQTVAWVAAGVVCSPDPAAGCVAGTALDWLSGHVGAIRACCAHLDEVLDADALFVLNSVRGVTPVRAVLGQSDETLRADLPSARHPLVRQLRELWAEALAVSARG